MCRVVRNCGRGRVRHVPRHGSACCAAIDFFESIIILRLSSASGSPSCPPATPPPPIHECDCKRFWNHGTILKTILKSKMSEMLRIRRGRAGARPGRGSAHNVVCGIIIVLYNVIMLYCNGGRGGVDLKHKFYPLRIRRPPA